MKTNEPPPPENQPPPESGATLAAPTGSADVPGTTHPSQMLRLVMQVEDTPGNRGAIGQALALLSAVRVTDQRWSIIKAEQVIIVKALTPETHSPNDPSSATAATKRPD